MEIDWTAVGWIIDMILNGFVWLIIAVLSLLVIDATDKWTRKAIKLMDKADKWIRKLTEYSFDWVEKKNLDDKGDYRPGMKAANLHKVRSPLIENDFTKD